LEPTYTIHLRLIEKRVVDFLAVLIKLFSLAVTAEALQAKIDWKSAFCKGTGQYLPNFQVEGDVPNGPPIIFAWIGLTTLSDSFTQRNIVADFFKQSAILVGLRGKVQCLSSAHWKERS